MQPANKFQQHTLHMIYKHTINIQYTYTVINIPATYSTHTLINIPATYRTPTLYKHTINIQYTYTINIPTTCSYKYINQQHIVQSISIPATYIMYT